MNEQTVRMDPKRHEVHVNGARKDFTPKEFAILYALKRADGVVMTRPEIYKVVWKRVTRSVSKLRTIDQHIARIRLKLDTERGALETVMSIGYKFNGHV